MTKQDEIAHLAKRLEDGWQRIAEAERMGQDTGRWCDFWASLLKQYCELCDELETQAEAVEQARML